jgi:hypothetical protein
MRIAAEPGRRTGWVTYAGIVFLVGTAFNAINGVTMLARGDFFDATGLPFGDLRTWGWVFVALAIVQLVVGVLILRLSPAGRVAGIVLSAISLIVWFLAMRTYPFWAVIDMVFYVLVIYGLVVYEEEFERIDG